LAAVGITNMRRQDVAESGSRSAASSMPGAKNNTSNGISYSAIASSPCTRYLKAYGTAEFDAISDPLIESIGPRGLGTGVSIISFVATECRLHETITIGQAVENLFEQQRHNRLPRVPIGGATTDPDVQASWDAFDRWVKHEGPRPRFPPIERIA